MCPRVIIGFIPDNRLRFNIRSCFLLAMLCTCFPLLYQYLRSDTAFNTLTRFDQSVITIIAPEPPSLTDSTTIDHPNMIPIVTPNVNLFDEIFYLSNSLFE